MRPGTYSNLSSMLRLRLKAYADPVVKFLGKHTPLIAIVFAGAFLRLYQLEAESLWHDEMVSVGFAHLENLSRILEASKTDNNFPLYYTILHYWIAFFGDSEFSVRFPSALVGIFSVVAMYRVGCLLFGRNEGLVASLILALSSLHIYYSQEARVVELMTLLALLSFYFFLKTLSQGEFAARAGYVVCTAALLYSHIYGLFVVFAQNLYYFAARLLFAGKVSLESTGQARGGAPGLGGWILLQALLLVLYVPGLVLLAGWILEPAGRDWIQRPSLGSVYVSLGIYAGSPLLLVLLLALSLLATVGLIRTGTNGRKKLGLLLAWFFTPVALPVVISLLSSPVFHYRYGIVATPALYLLAAKGAQDASTAFASWGALRREPTRAPRASTAWFLVAVAALAVLSSGVLWRYFNTVDKTQWREAAEHVEATAQANDLVLVYPGYELKTIDQYYFDRLELEKEPVRSAADGAAVAKSILQHDRVWVVHRRTEERFPFDSFLSKRSYIPVDEAGFGPYSGEGYPYYPVPDGVWIGGRQRGIDVTLYEKK
jgi:mannosyltransferase